MKHKVTPKGVCPRKLEFELDDNIIRNIHFKGGCSGNLQALSILLEGMKVEDVKDKLLGIHCGLKSTSCSDQLARAVIKAAEEEKS